ncbi:hypothetical protein ACFQ1S_20905 [Kibdelosporangium lantanae]|uniref:Uncharacterized protein n=1 Tax=Kibdelosporangium lantanae TaxID=1497396 RepID=A0ABW3MCP0_9PSEU
MRRVLDHRVVNDLGDRLDQGDRRTDGVLLDLRFLPAVHNAVTLFGNPFEFRGGIDSRLAIEL